MPVFLPFWWPNLISSNQLFCWERNIWFPFLIQLKQYFSIWCKAKHIIHIVPKNKSIPVFLHIFHWGIEYLTIVPFFLVFRNLTTSVQNQKEILRFFNIFLNKIYKRNCKNKAERVLISELSLLLSKKKVIDIHHPFSKINLCCWEIYF